MNLKDVLDNFSLEKNELRRHLDNNGQLTALAEPPVEFQNVAKAILSGYFRIKNSSTSEYIEVHPTCVEIYYHEEQDNGVKDPIVYHRNRETNSGAKNNPPVFPLGVLHNHVSGIDITFERKADSRNTYITDIVRASALIREFMVKGKNGEWVEITKNGKRIKSNIEDRSTYIYEYLFGQFSIFDGFGIEWVDGKECDLAELSYRKNVTVYESEGADYKKSKPYRQDLRRWQFRKR